MSVRRYLDVSTEHVPSSLLNQAGGLNAIPGVHAYAYDYGTWLIVPSPDGPEKPIPAEILKLWEYARLQDCDVIRLDADGETIDGLPVYEWAPGPTPDWVEALRRLVLSERNEYSESVARLLQVMGYEECYAPPRVEGQKLTVFLGGHTDESVPPVGNRLVRDIGGTVGPAMSRDSYWVWVWTAPLTQAIGGE